MTESTEQKVQQKSTQKKKKNNNNGTSYANLHITFHMIDILQQTSY